MTCSIIVLNYFGEKVIAKVLDSLLALNYPKGEYEIIVVDNASTDKSSVILKKYAQEYQSIKNIFLDQNYGFSKGNNFGIKAAKGKYVTLLNNDCVVEKNWLRELVKSMEKDPKIFAVNSKILFYPKYVVVEIKIDKHTSPLLAWLSKSEFLNFFTEKKIYLNWWQDGDVCKIEVPYDGGIDRRFEFKLLLHIRKRTGPDDIKKLITPLNSGIKFIDLKRNAEEAELTFELEAGDRYIKKNSLSKIQNAGIMVFQDGYGRDIGAVIRYSKQYADYDLGQFDHSKEVYATCAAAVLYKKKVLDQIGYLDESFFMYYEDVELSERGRFSGYKSVYSHKAVCRHLHALSSREWSPFFVYHVEKGRLLHVFYSFPLNVFVKEITILIKRVIISALMLPLKLRKFFADIKTKPSNDNPMTLVIGLQYIKILLFFIIFSPVLIIRRLHKQLKRKETLVWQNYQKILEGNWYFK